MIPLVEEHLDEIIALCEENEIKGLWLFGSAATGNWDPERSDLDFLFDIGEYNDSAGMRWMRLNSGLIRIFGENFDLVSRPAIKRPKFRASVDKTAIPIYER
ncbi:MAG: nucleotidyltransferase domain-containing protein [Thermomicrobiales bacterium]|nr:nucleotidyltransferase domain-containing protein [Thermomicrobiales bacterium]